MLSWMIGLVVRFLPSYADLLEVDFVVVTNGKHYLSYHYNSG